jgi:large subunit ribosomal protein L15
MKLHELKPTPGSKKRRQRVGRGDGSNWGGTAGRGHKGQKSRTGSRIRHHFEGGQTPYFRRLPKKGFNSPDHVEYSVVNVASLNEAYEAGETVDFETLRAKRLVGKKVLPLKILGCGEIAKALKVKAVKFSATAKAKIEAAGGSCETPS